MNESLEQIRERVTRELNSRRQLLERMPYRMRKACEALLDAERFISYSTESVRHRRSWYQVSGYSFKIHGIIKQGVRSNAKYAVAKAALALALLGLANGKTST